MAGDGLSWVAAQGVACTLRVCDWGDGWVGGGLSGGEGGEGCVVHRMCIVWEVPASKIGSTGENAIWVWCHAGVLTEEGAATGRAASAPPQPVIRGWESPGGSSKAGGLRGVGLVGLGPVQSRHPATPTPHTPVCAQPGPQMKRRCTSRPHRAPEAPPGATEPIGRGPLTVAARSGRHGQQEQEGEQDSLHGALDWCWGGRRLLKMRVGRCWTRIPNPHSAHHVATQS